MLKPKFTKDFLCLPSDGLPRLFSCISLKCANPVYSLFCIILACLTSMPLGSWAGTSAQGTALWNSCLPFKRPVSYLNYFHRLSWLPGTTTPTLSPLSHTPCVTLSSLFIRQLPHYILWTCEFLQARNHLIHLWGPVPWRWPPYHGLSVEFLDFISQKMSSCWKIFSTTQSKQYSKRISGYT